MSETIYHRYRLKRRTTAGWAANNEVLLAGEPGIEVLVDGTERIKYGDGVKTWAQLSYAAGGGGVGPAGPTGPAGPAGAAGAAATVGVGTVTTGAAGSAAAVANAGTSSAAVFNFTIPRGDTGAAGPQGPEGAASTVPGPQGPAGPAGATGPAGSAGAAATIAVGTVTTGAAGSAAAINNAGTNSAAVFDFTIPRGDTGATGPQGPAGATGPAGAAGAQGPAGPVAGTNGQLIYNNAGAAGGLSTLTADANGNLTFTARWIQSTNGAASAPPMSLTGTWFTGGTSTTTKPQLLIEPAGTTSNNWSTAGTGLGVNAPPGFTGNLLDLQVNGLSHGRIGAGTKNIFLGEGAGGAVTNYSGMVVIGQNACGSVTTAGINIVAIGVGALRYLNVANGSTEATAVGPAAGSRIVNAGSSVLLGGYAGQGSANFSAQIQRTTCAGFEAGAGFNATTLADNTLFGYRAGFAISSGNQNTFIGSGAGSAVTTGSNNIAIGFNAAVDSITASNQINIGGVYYDDRIEGSKRFTGNVGFYNSTPIAQPAAVADATDAASVITQLNLALARLRTLGLIAT